MQTFERIVQRIAQHTSNNNYTGSCKIRSRRRHGIDAFALLLISFLSTAAIAQTAQPCSDSIDRNAAVLSNGFAFDSANSRNQVSDINADNVSNLSLAYAHAAVGATEKRGAPAVTEQAIFFSAGRDIVAMNRHSGCVYWTYAVKGGSAGIHDNGVRSSAIYLINGEPLKPALIVAGDGLGVIYVVNAQTGQEIWKKFVGTYAKHHWITGSFQYYGGKLFVPIASKEVITIALTLSKCCVSHGMLRAIDPYTGRYIWTYHVTATAKPIAEINKQGPNGGSIWSVPAIDPSRNTIYIGTGQNYTPPVTNTSDAIIALDMSKGKVRWIFQATADDAWNASCEAPAPHDIHCVRPAGHDFDFGAPPIFVRQADGRDAVLAADKAGFVYNLDPATGAARWTRKVGEGAKLGGVHFGMAVDTRKVYVAVSDANVNKGGLTATNKLLALAGGLFPPLTPVEGGTPGIYALDIETGVQSWAITPTHMYEGQSYVSIYSAALSVTNDVLFAGALDGELRAFSTQDGTELWRFNSNVEFVDVMGASGKGGTIDSVGAVPAGDMLLLNSGYDNFGGVDPYQAGPGNALFVFRLP